MSNGWFSKRLGHRDLDRAVRRDVLGHRRVRNQPSRVGDPGLEEVGPEPRRDLTEVGPVDDLVASASA